MEYKGKLYARIGNKYLGISHTDEFEALNLEITIMKDALFIRNKIIDGCDKKLKEFETELSMHQTFTNWLDEELDGIDTNDALSHDFVNGLKNRLLLIIEQQNIL